MIFFVIISSGFNASSTVAILTSVPGKPLWWKHWWKHWCIHDGCQSPPAPQSTHPSTGISFRENDCGWIQIWQGGKVLSNVSLDVKQIKQKTCWACCMTMTWRTAFALGHCSLWKLLSLRQSQRSTTTAVMMAEIKVKSAGNKLEFEDKIISPVWGHFWPWASRLDY